MRSPFQTCVLSCSVAIFAFSIFSVALLAEVIHVPGDFVTIQEAIDFAVDGDVVEIADGVYRGEGNRDLDFLGKAITVRGASGDPEVCVIYCEGTIDNEHRGFCFCTDEGMDSMVEGLTIMNGFAEQGGGVYCSGSSLTLNNCIIMNCTAESEGGGIYCSSGSPTRINCTIKNNAVLGDDFSLGGGGVFQQYSNATMIGCVIADNTANRGGGVYCMDADSVMIRCAINGNTSFERGGGVCLALGSPLLLDCTISENVAEYGGGAFCVSSSPSLSNCTVTNNHSLLDGGGLFCYQDFTMLSNCNIWGNTAYYHGGGITFYESEATLNVCKITDNSADGFLASGGGIYFDSGGFVSLTNCWIHDNTAEYDGGGALCSDSDSVLYECSFNNNTAMWGDGGGLYCEHSHPLLTDCSFLGNLADSGDGGGIYLHESDPILVDCSISINETSHDGGGAYFENSNPVLTNCSIASNITTHGNGGGIYCSGGIPVLDNCSISNNTADGNGGGVSCYDESTPVLTDCEIRRNEAILSGGGFYLRYSSPILTNCTIDDNMSGANEHGGGFYCYYSNPMLVSCSIINNVSQGIHGSGGGIYCVYSNPKLINSQIANNTADDGGGGICCRESAPEIIGCLISGNSAEKGGGIYCDYSDGPMLINCTLSGNTAEQGPGLACDSNSQVFPSDVSVFNSVLWNGMDSVWNNDDSDLMIKYCDIQSGWIGVGNIDLDPLFVDPDGGDYHLLPGSPCIDAGDNDAVPDDVMTDLDGYPRFVDDPGRYDIGNGVSPLVDIGCYEFQNDSDFISVLAASPDTLMAGQDGMFTVVNSTPGTATYLAYSLSGLGSTYVPPLNVTLDLDQPKQSGEALTTDAGGNVVWILSVPSAGAGRDVWFQACQFELTTNVVETEVE